MIKLYPHQEEALKKLSNGKILWGGVGSGKSAVAVEYYRRIEADADVYVITTAKKRDKLEWESEFVQAGIYKSLDATRGGRLTVDSWNNIGKYADVQGAFFVFDEQRLVGSGQWSHVFLRLVKRNRWILLSATPGDTWLDYIPVFIANGFYKNRTEFKRRHVVYSSYTKFPKVERYTEVGHLVRLKNEILVEMPYLRHTIRHEVEIRVDHDEELLDKVLVKRWHVFENRPLRDIAEMFGVLRKVVNSHPSRLAAVADLLQRHSRVIVFYNFNYELDALRELFRKNSSDDGSLSEEPRFERPNPGSSSTPILPSMKSGTSSTKTSDVVIAEWNGHIHQEVPDTSSWVYLVQYTAGAEGWNCTDTDAMIFFSLNYSWKIMQQARGRIDRLNTLFTNLYYYTLVSNSVIDSAILKSLRNKKSFNEARFLKNS